MTLQIETSARALALQCGAMTVAEIVAWADSVILSEADFDPRLIDLSLAKTAAAALSALNAFGPSRETPRVARRAFGFFHAALLSGRADYSRIAKALYDMAHNDCVPDPAHDAPMWNFWDTLDLAAEGIAGDVETVKAEMLAFLQANMD